MKEMNFAGIERCNRPVFFCSFGKDSSSVLHGLEPWLDKVMVVFVDCGGVYPDIVDWARLHEKLLPKFTYIKSPGDIWEDVRQKGWPLDVEVAHLGSFGAMMGLEPLANRHKIRPYTHCIYERFWVPSNMFTQLYGADCIITGERKQDRPYAEDWHIRNNGTGRAIRPIFDWSDEDIWEYIDSNKIQLTKTYQGRQSDRRDCYICMGGHDLSLQRIMEFKHDWPDLYYKVFIEEGLAEIIPVMIQRLGEIGSKWSEIYNKVIKE